jgi:FkbM family methyltransferase
MAHTSTITVILPIYQLAGRGLDRVDRSLYSIALNSAIPPVIVMDGSQPDQFAAVESITARYPFAQHVAWPLQRFNMPVLFNRGIERAQTPYLFCTGADFLYRQDFFARLGQTMTPDSFVVAPVRMLPRCDISEAMVAAWSFPPTHPNAFGTWADGLQCFHRSWYDRAGGYDERMAGWGGMDNDHHFRARRAGLHCRWLEGSEVLHIWHETEKASGPDRAEKQQQSRLNWRLRDTDKTIQRNQPMHKELVYQVGGGPQHRVRVVVKDPREEVQAHWMKGNFYETQRHGLLNLLYQRCHSGTFVDVGAFIGNHSLFFAACCQAERVLAFEPAAEAFEHLTATVRLNPTLPITAFAIALGEQQGRVGLRFSTVDPGQGGAMMTAVDESGASVALQRLDDIVSQQGIEQLTCIKIDVEGYSLPVLRGARESIRRFRPVVTCECRTAEEYQAVDDYLRELGYGVHCVEGKPFTMNHTPTYLWTFQEAVDVTVVITTYNRPDSLRRLLESLMADAGDLRVDCRVYDDRSTVPYSAMPAGSERFRITYVEMERHHGKQEYWRIVDRIFSDLQHSQSRYYVQIPDDVTAQPGFLRHAIETYQQIQDPDKICLNLYLDCHRIGKANWTATLPQIERHNGVSVFKTGWIDLCYLAERRFFETLSFRIDPIGPERWRRNPLLSSGVGMQITHRLQGRGLYQVRQGYLASASVPSAMNPDRPAGEDLATCQLDPIVGGVASIPDRRDYLRQAVASILPSLDQLHVYLNGYPDVPDFLDHPKIVVQRSQEHGDLGDAGKFYGVAAGATRGYYFALDDDIVYPPDFVWTLLNRVRAERAQGRKVAVGLHGKVMPPQVKHYYQGHVRQYHGAHALAEAKAVHVLATCALVFHTDDLPLSMADFAGPRNMADIHFSIACQRRQVGCVVIPRPDRYIHIQPIPAEKTIWGQFHRNDQVQTDLYNSWRDWRLYA